jgi:citrate/tricarballylate utilization protein
MLDPELFREADRQLTVCNACRYCEGICPVFPALERRSMFAEGDITFLANLCHDCQACFHVCPFSPPHELDVNLPKVLAEVRVGSYERYAWPTALRRLFAHGTSGMAAITFVAVAIVVVLVFVARSDRLFQTYTQPGSFYEIVPWLVMFVPALLATAYGFLVMGIGLWRFWRETGGSYRSRLDLRAFLAATADVLVLRQMRGGGPGCSYPTEAPSHGRVVLHQLVFYGFLATFVATVLAAFYQEILGVLPPYPLLSVVVIPGTVGGIAQVVGCIGLLWLKARSTPEPITRRMRSLDDAFLFLLVATNVTGLALLAARDTAAMGVLLAIHLGVVAGLFIAMPYGKFVHVIYRYGALVRNRQEELAERATETAG